MSKRFACLSKTTLANGLVAVVMAPAGDAVAEGVTYTHKNGFIGVPPDHYMHGRALPGHFFVGSEGVKPPVHGGVGQVGLVHEMDEEFPDLAGWWWTMFHNGHTEEGDAGVILDENGVITGYGEGNQRDVAFMVAECEKLAEALLAQESLSKSLAAARGEYVPGSRLKVKSALGVCAVGMARYVAMERGVDETQVVHAWMAACQGMGPRMRPEARDLALDVADVQMQMLNMLGADAVPNAAEEAANMATVIDSLTP